MPDKVDLIMSPDSKAMPIEEFDKLKKEADKEYEGHSQREYLKRSKHEHGARPVIKAQLEARRKLNLHNGDDWKVKFLEDKLDRSKAISEKLKSLIKI